MAATAYKTPGVYVEEISLFPPSVAEVETAIPAFIGYTEKAETLSAQPLKDIPTKVKSLLEFESYFGKGPKINLTEVILDENNNFFKATIEPKFYLYDSIRLFFDNGGGNCYVVSVGVYSDNINAEQLKAGIEALKKYDEPTILLFPDAASLEDNKLGAVQQKALKQCMDLGDRVGVFDTRKDDPNGINFRNNIGINNLKYGAAYTPWLKVNYGKSVSYKDLSKDEESLIQKDSTNRINLNTLTTDKDIQANIQKLENALLDVDTTTNPLQKDKKISDEFSKVLTGYQNDETTKNMEEVFKFLFELASRIDGLRNTTKGTELRNDLDKAISNSLKNAFSELISNEKELAGKITSYDTQWDKIDPKPGATQWNGIFTSSLPAPSDKISDTAKTDEQKCDAILPSLNKNFAIINEAINSFILAASQYVKTYEKVLYDTFPIYQNLIKGINDTLTEVPPSGAIAGIYAMVDNQRGVWKAPANVSLASVVGPTYNFDSSETDALNIDANAGKSINAIRAFSGKGTLVWGARTLAGNDNEWRYIPVRRFFNMAEESIKKSTYWAVFEPNDANLWVKVRGMIENFLTQKWREGALAGATTKDAFFVKCGLGTTMTSQDILEGRLNVEIGMAVVRPAEFIILKFSHKLQTS